MHDFAFFVANGPLTIELQSADSRSRASTRSFARRSIGIQRVPWLSLRHVDEAAQRTHRRCLAK